MYRHFVLPDTSDTTEFNKLSLPDTHFGALGEASEIEGY